MLATRSASPALRVLGARALATEARQRVHHVGAAAPPPPPPARGTQDQPYGPSRRARQEQPTAGFLPERTRERTVHPANPPGSPPLPVLFVRKRGGEVLEDAVTNYGAAHSQKERDLLGLGPFLPSSVHTLETQVERAYMQLQLRQKIAQSSNDDDGDLMQYTFLRSLKDQNAVLYYALLQRNLKETMRVIYTPVVGAAIQNYSRIFRRPDGTFISYPAYKAAIDAARGDRDAGRRYIRDAITHFGHLGEEDVDLLTCTDSEGILGIGDQGVGGINIAIGKNTIYAVGGGFDPQRTLSIGLDVGTNNMSLLADPMYLGWRHPRLRGEEYDAFMDDYVGATAQCFPHALLHFEDFGTHNAHRLMVRYRQQGRRTFWDDAEGTAAVTLAAVLSAVKVSQSTLLDQRYVIFGAGTAGLGIATQIRDAIAIRQGVSQEEASKRLYLIDRNGLLVQGGEMREAQIPFARSRDEVAAWTANQQGGFSLLEVVRQIHPTVLIGVSGQSGAFSEEVVREMSAHCAQPAIFPLSNPSRLAEARPDDINKWSCGKALIATGSPFPAVAVPNSDRMYPIAESNNALAFPGLAGGVTLSRSPQLSKGMIVAGVDAIASLSPALRDPMAALLPDLVDIRAVSMKVSAAVALAAKEEGLATVPLPDTLEEMERFARHRAWRPLYRELRPDTSHAEHSSQWE